MAHTLDSVHVFKKRSLEVGLSQVAVDALVTKGIDTLARVAFCSGYQVGTADDRPLLAVLDDALARGGTAIENAAFRRLHFEASTLAMADLKSKVDRTDEEAPKKIPQVERAARYKDQVRRLAGMSLVGEYECSHALLNEVSQQREDDVLRYLPPDKCTKREQELGGVKRLSSDPPLLADVSTELRTRAALCRRALAYDQSELISFAISEKWHDKLYQQLLRAPIPGYAAISMTQALQADKTFFITLATATRDGISPLQDGTRPLEVHFAEAMADPQVATLLQPLAAGKRKHEEQEKKDKKKEDRKRVDPPAPGAGATRKERKAAKGKGKGTGGSLPEILLGMHSKTPDGDPICFKFNMICGCSFGAACRNKHVCCMPGCYKDHSVLQHPP